MFSYVRRGKKVLFNFPRGNWKALATSLRNIKVVPKSRPLEESKEQVRCRDEKGGGILLKHASFVEVGMATGAGLGRDTPIPFPSQNIKLLSIPVPNPSRGRVSVPIPVFKPKL